MCMQPIGIKAPEQEFNYGKSYKNKYELVMPDGMCSAPKFIAVCLIFKYDYHKALTILKMWHEHLNLKGLW